MKISIQLFIIIASLSIFSSAFCQSSYPFVPSNFEIPKLLETDKFRLRMLTVNDVIKDYDAVMTSVDHLKGVFGPNSKWPSKELTFEQDLIDLGWHQKEFQRRSSFAYTVMNIDESQCLGCIYIVPTRKKGYDVVVYAWVRKSEFDKGLDSILFDSVKNWVANEWPFKNVTYPGREIDWSKWESLPE